MKKTTDQAGAVRARQRRAWLHEPHRLKLRRAIFQIHLWSGIVLTLYAVVIGLTGSALVFKTEMERALNPSVFHVTPSGQRFSLSAVVTQIEQSRPGWAVFAVRNFDKPTEGTAALMRRVGIPADADYRIVTFNPYTGEVLTDTKRFAGVLGWLYNLHFYLLSGKEGLTVSGWCAVAMLLLFLSGLVVWWPGVRRWASSLVFHRRSNWRRLNWDLHAVVGFWSCAALLLVTTTGIYFAFPGPTATLVRLATLSRPREARPLGGASADKNRRVRILTIDEAIIVATRLLPKDAPPSYLGLPGSAGKSYSVTGYYKGSAPFSQLATASFDARTGLLQTRSDTREQNRGDRAVQYFFALHFGAFGGEGLLGTLVKVLWFLLGTIPAVLAVTGFLMFWNRKLRQMRQPAYPAWMLVFSRRAKSLDQPSV